MIQSYNNFLLERIYDGNLYHVVDIEKLLYILNNNEIKSYKFSLISTTRNKFLNGYIGDSPISIFKLELDGKKLTTIYDSKPFTYISNTKIEFTEEDEEQIQTNKIENVFEYIDKVILLKSRVNNLLDSGWFTTDGGHFGNTRMNLPQILKFVIKVIKKKGLELYVQDGKEIKKDNAYIESILNYPIKQINHGYAYYFRGSVEEYNVKWKINTHIEKTYPLDSRNKEIEELVIGHDYNNLWISKDKLKPNDKMDNFKLYIFDFKYELENIVSETENEVLVKTAHLSNISPDI